jgi:aerobic carbon-monoxide dehydrogenase medium subunit
MIAAPFTYHRANSVNDAVRLLGQFGSDAKLLAGGHSLIPLLKLRLAQPAHVIDISRIRDLSDIREENNTLLIGALTTHQQLESSDLLKSKCPLLVETAAQVGDVQVRNKGTLGGSAAHADPASDYPAALFALEAQFVLQGPNGSRTISVDDFFVSMLTSALGPDEILTQIRIPAQPRGTGASYQKFAQKASGFAICGVAALITRANGKCTRARIGITGIAQKAYRATAVEQAIEGRSLTQTEIAAAAAKASDGVDALGDIHASADYRKDLARIYTRRAIEAAIA